MEFGWVPPGCGEDSSGVNMASVRTTSGLEKWIFRGNVAKRLWQGWTSTSWKGTTMIMRKHSWRNDGSWVRTVTPLGRVCVANWWTVWYDESHTLGRYQLALRDQVEVIIWDNEIGLSDWSGILFLWVMVFPLGRLSMFSSHYLACRTWKSIRIYTVP